ncbi:MAG: prepilin-type N-terminal cleavage/methylation domain-containing protein [Candidatus Gracilibacteria bacterium]|nr:prepilin-type N-terminal cleavage/methylation domain-containing protein [Candidatus Gracilibacteria bacterium]
MQTNGTSPLPKTPSKKSRIHNYHGFTLVELIVVITILVILGTIAFTSLSGYSGNARDSSRVSDLTNLSKGLDIASIKTGSYPTPDNPFTITYSGGIIWTQGTIGDSVINTLSSVGAKMNKKPTDPLITSKEYTYSKLAYGNAYQIKTDWEGDSIAYRNDIIDQANAASGNPILSYIKGNYSGVVAKTQTGTTICILALPSIITSTGTVTGSGIDIANLANRLLYHGKTNSGGIVFSPKSVFCGANLPSNDGGGQITALVQNLQSAYSGSEIAGQESIAAVLSATGAGLTNLGGDIITKQLGGNIVPGITPATCNFGEDGSSGICKDPYWNNVVLMMHMDGASGSTSFVDEKGHTVSAYGNAVISNIQSKFGGKSGKFDSLGPSHLRTTLNETLNGDFTIEYWRMGSTSTVDFTAFSPTNGHYVYFVNQLRYELYSGGGITPYSTLSINSSTWYHIAIVRSGSDLKIFINGSLANGSSASGITRAFELTTLDIGWYAYNANLQLTGYIDDFRITKGVARYTSDFTPPSRAFPNQ